MNYDDIYTMLLGLIAIIFSSSAAKRTQRTNKAVLRIEGNFRVLKITYTVAGALFMLMGFLGLLGIID